MAELTCSLEHHPTGQMYSRRHDTDVQDPCAQLFDHRLLAVRPIPRRYQIRRLPSHHHGHAHECLLLVHLAGEACGEALQGATSGKHLQPLRPTLGLAPICDSHCCARLHYRTFQVY